MNMNCIGTFVLNNVFAIQKNNAGMNTVLNNKAKNAANIIR